VQSKEIVKRAIHFKCPPRLPTRTIALGGVSDAVFLPVKPAASFVPAVEGEDEWSCVWVKPAASFVPSVEGEDEGSGVWTQTGIDNMGQVTEHPLKDMSDFDKIAVPDYTDDSRYTDCTEFLEKAEADGKYVLSGIFMLLFERMHTLYGFENTLVDIYQDRPSMEAMADRIVDTHVTYVQEVARRFPGRVDGWWMTDDWGTQNNSFISLDLWMDFFYPRCKKIFDAMHDAGCDVWVHSCGKINDIIEGYIKAGVNVVNMMQPRAVGIEEIAQRYAGRIAFESLADIQVTLPKGDKGHISADVEALMTQWARPEGGLIFNALGDDNSLGITSETTKPHMYEAFSRWSEKIYGKPLPPVHLKP